MKHLALLIFLTGYTISLFGQTNQEYSAAIHKADSLGGSHLFRDTNDSLSRFKNISEAIKLYNTIPKEYFVGCGETKTMLDAAILGDNETLYNNAMIRMIGLRGESVKTVNEDEIYFIRQVYRVNDFDLSPKLNKVYQHLLQENNTLLKEANSNLNWQVIMMLNAMTNTVREYRSLVPDELFKDTFVTKVRKYKRWKNSKSPYGKTIGSDIIDSLHFVTFFNYVKENGFPKAQEMGCYSYQIWPILRHSLSLLVDGDKEQNDMFLKMWKELIPILYENTQNGNYPADWYSYVYEDLLKITKDMDKETVDYFHKYKITTQ